MRHRLSRLEDASGPPLRSEELRNERVEELFEWELQRYLEGNSGLAFVDKKQAFYTDEGELALSRTYANLERIFDSL